MYLKEALEPPAGTRNHFPNKNLRCTSYLDFSSALAHIFAPKSRVSGSYATMRYEKHTSETGEAATQQRDHEVPRRNPQTDMPF